VEIKIIENRKKDFLDLLLLADEQESMIDKYLNRGILFALYDDSLKSICVVTDEGSGVFEIQNLATYAEFQGRGFGKHLVSYVCNYFKDKGSSMLVGTGDVPKTVSFYERCGFVFSHRLENYFIENYEKPMFEEGVQLKDKVYFKRDLYKCLQIETERLLLRKWTATDIADLVDGLNNYNVSKNYPMPFPFTVKDAEAYVKKVNAPESKNYVFAIILKENGKVAGGCGIYYEEDINMGIWLNEKYHGKGYGTEAFRRLAKFGFDELGIEEYINGFLEGNTASLQMQQKIGSKLANRLEERDCPARAGMTKEIKTVLRKEDLI
jgi:RimJ/RimL family protein N-acetyltransferase